MLIYSGGFRVRGAVQQFKIGRKIKANRALNPKRSEFFSAKSNYWTASREVEVEAEGY